MNEETKLVFDLLNDAHRADRILRRAADGHLYCTTDKTYLGNDGPYTPPYVSVPVAYEGSEEEIEQWAEAIIRELDDELPHPANQE